jgi:hypothetical protein
MFNLIYFIWYKTSGFFYTFLAFYILAMLYCFVFKISLMRFFVYFILPIIELVVNLWTIFLQLLSLPYHLYVAIKKVILSIFGMFGFVFNFISDILTFSSNLTRDIYILS